MNERIDAEALRGHTPGPWEWRHNELGRRTALITPDRGRLVIMDLARAGMQGAEPRFAYWNGINDGEPRGRQGGVLQAGTEHVDARLIAAAPALLAEVIERRARDAAVAELVEAVKKALAHSDRVRDERHFGLRDKPTQAHYNRIVAALAAIQGATP